VKRENYLFDFSKNLIDQKTFDLLLQLAEETQLKAAINLCFLEKKSMKPKKSRSTHCFERFF
jgi:glucose-6-phosphate isomerase